LPFTAAAPLTGIVPLSGLPLNVPAPLPMSFTWIPVIGGLAVTGTNAVPFTALPGTITRLLVVVPLPLPVKGSVPSVPTEMPIVALNGIAPAGAVTAKVNAAPNNSPKSFFI
jgi:hypothetical protein